MCAKEKHENAPAEQMGSGSGPSVLGTGAAGLSAALTAAAQGSEVLVLEKTEFLGGTTAYSAGTCWCPTTDSSVQTESWTITTAPHAIWMPWWAARPRVKAGSPIWTPRRRCWTRCTTSASPSVAPLPWSTTTPNFPRPARPDAHWNRTPSTGACLDKADFGRVRPPVPEFALLGGTLMLRRAEVSALLKLYNGSLAERGKAVALAAQLGLRWALDRLTRPRGTRLVMGNGLVARCSTNRASAGRNSFSVRKPPNYLRTGTVLYGAVVAQNGTRLRVRSRQGVVLAAGGFAQNAEMRKKLLPSPTPLYSRAGEGSTGDTLSLAGRPVPRWPGITGKTHCGSPAPSDDEGTVPAWSSRTSGTVPVPA